MPEIPEIGVQRISVPEILEWRSLPPQSIPNEPPITLQLGFPVADIPGCVETRSSAAGDEQVYTDDPRGNLVVCGAEMPSYKPLDFTPGTLTYSRAKPPPIDTDIKKPAGKSGQPDDASLPPSADLDVSNVAKELPCPPPDAIPLGAKNKAQTAVIIGYKRMMKASARRFMNSWTYQRSSAIIFLVRLLWRRLRRQLRLRRRLPSSSNR